METLHWLEVLTLERDVYSEASKIPQEVLEKAHLTLQMREMMMISVKKTRHTVQVGNQKDVLIVK
jgi:hypothetical protein